MRDFNIIPVIGIVVFVLLIFFIFFNPVVIIDSSERGVVKNLGVVQKSLMTDGFNLRLPFFTSVKKMSIKTQTISAKTNIYTKDNQPLQVFYNVQYSLPETLLTYIAIHYASDPTQDFVVPMVETAIKNVIGNYTASETITMREKIRQEIIQKTKELIVNPSLKRSIVNIIDIPLTNIDFDDSYEKAIAEKQVQLEKAKKKEYELMAAEKEAKITITKANADAEAIRVKTQALVQSPQYIQLELVSKWDGKSPSILITNPKASTDILLPIK